jgi:hypothetical protein
MALFSKSKQDSSNSAPRRKPPALPIGDVMEGAIVPGTHRQAPNPARASLSVRPESSANREIRFELGDLLIRIPSHFLKPGPHDAKRELRFQLADLFSDITRGRATVPLSRIIKLCPEIFDERSEQSQDIDIHLPLQKLVEQIGLLPSGTSPAEWPGRQQLPALISQDMAQSAGPEGGSPQIVAPDHTDVTRQLSALVAPVNKRPPVEPARLIEPAKPQEEAPSASECVNSLPAVAQPVENTAPEGAFVAVLPSSSRHVTPPPPIAPAVSSVVSPPAPPLSTIELPQIPHLIHEPPHLATPVRTEKPQPAATTNSLSPAPRMFVDPQAAVPNPARPVSLSESATPVSPRAMPPPVIPVVPAAPQLALHLSPGTRPAATIPRAPSREQVPRIVAGWCGIDGCAVIDRRGVTASGVIPKEFALAELPRVVDGILGFVERHPSPTGLFQALEIHYERTSLSIFPHGEKLLCVFHRDLSLPMDLRERLRERARLL